MKIAYITILGLLLSSGLSVAQTNIKGNVTDIGGKGLFGAVVTIKKTGIQVNCDSLGGFAAQIRQFPVTLIGSMVGYETKELTIPTAPSGSILIRLAQKTTLLQEAQVSTGYQTLPRERATGAFSFIDNNTFNEQVTGDVLSRLEAVANGLDVSQTTTLGGSDLGIRIRGLSTLSSGGIRDPLIVVDNFPYEGSLTNINPNDVENITILKDAAASSIWGARAGNGVIVIKTKTGRMAEKLSVTAVANTTVTPRPNLDYFQTMDSRSYLELERFLFSNGHRFSDTSAWNKKAFSPAYEIMFRQYKSEISDGQANALLNNLAQVDVKEQFENHVYQLGVNQQYAVAVRGGTNRLSHYISAGYDQSKSELNDRYKRLTVSFKNSYQPVKQLRVSVDMNHTFNETVSGHQGYAPASTLPPYTLLATEDGEPMAVPHFYRQPYLDTLGNGRLLDWNYYPLLEDGLSETTSKINSTVLNTSATFNPWEWLKMDVLYQFQGQNIQARQLFEENSYYARDLVNTFSQISPVNGEVTYRVPKGGINDLSRTRLSVHNLRGLFNIKRTWANHELNSLAGGEIRSSVTSGNRMRSYGFDPETLAFGQVDYVARYPNIITKVNSFIPSNDFHSELTNRFASVFANAAYQYMGTYLFTVSGRRDASNLFGVNTNDKWNILWSLGAGWTVSNEPFWPKGSIPHLKLRATYGKSGNVDMGKSAVTTFYYLPQQSPYTQRQMARVAQHANPELRWEQVTMTNFGLDFSTRQGRISGNIDVYLKKGDDLLGPAPMDITTGTSSTITKNVAALKGNGMDVELRSLNVSNSKFSWQTELNLSQYKDKVLAYYRSSAPQGSIFVSGATPAMIRLEGYPIFAMFSYRWKGLDPENGDPIGYVDGKPSKDYNAITGAGTNESDIRYHGSSVPTVFGSLGNTFSWGNLSMSIRLIYKFGYYIKNEGVNYNSLFIDRPYGFHREFVERWKAPGDESRTFVPSLVYPNQSDRTNFYLNSEVKVERADHIRLQYITLSYDFSGKTRMKFLKQPKIYLNLNNIGILWKATDSGIDPAYGASVLPPAFNCALGLQFSL